MDDGSGSALLPRHGRGAQGPAGQAAPLRSSSCSSPPRRRLARIEVLRRAPHRRPEGHRSRTSTSTCSSPIVPPEGPARAGVSTSPTSATARATSPAPWAFAPSRIPEPLRNLFIRSDQYNFIRHGIPSVIMDVTRPIRLARADRVQDVAEGPLPRAPRTTPRSRSTSPRAALYEADRAAGSWWTSPTRTPGRVEARLVLPAFQGSKSRRAAGRVRHPLDQSCSSVVECGGL